MDETILNAIRWSKPIVCDVGSAHNRHQGMLSFVEPESAFVDDHKISAPNVQDSPLLETIYIHVCS